MQSNTAKNELTNRVHKIKIYLQSNFNSICEKLPREIKPHLVIMFRKQLHEFEAFQNFACLSMPTSIYTLYSGRR